MFKARKNKGKRSEITIDPSSTTETWKGTIARPSENSDSVKRASKKSEEASQMKSPKVTSSSSEIKYPKSEPSKPDSHIRTTTRFDYQPDICKDYKETGYCGYGDSCKFLHDRGDYKSGLQLEKEWEEIQNKKRKLGLSSINDIEEENYEIRSDDESQPLPFACFLCRNPFSKPIKTKCLHFFCEECALERYSKTSKCAVCGEPTFGIFNVAHEIVSEQKKRLEFQDKLANRNE